LAVFWTNVLGKAPLRRIARPERVGRMVALPRLLLVLSAVAVSAVLALTALAQGSASLAQLDLSFRTIERSSGSSSRLSEQRTIAIRTTRRWKQAWRQLHPGSSKKAPRVDFSRYTLLLASQGEQPTSGYAITIERVVLDGGEVTLHVVETSPTRRRRSARSSRS